MLATTATPTTATATPVTLPTVLRRIRLAHGLTLRHGAASAGISRSMLAAAEAGQRQPSRELIDAIAAGWRLPLHEHDRLLIAAGYLPTPATWAALLGLARTYAGRTSPPPP